VTTGSIAGYFAELTPGIEWNIIGAIVRVYGPQDFPNSFDLTTGDVLGKTLIHTSEASGDFAGGLSIRLTGGWYALVFAAAGTQDKFAAVMPGVNEEIGDLLYFFGRTTTDVNLTSSESSRGCSGGLGPRVLRATRKNQSSRSNCGSNWWNDGFEYLDGRGEGGLDGVRMFVDSDPAAPVPETATLLLLGSGLAGLGGVAWRQHRQN